MNLIKWNSRGLVTLLFFLLFVLELSMLTFAKGIFGLHASPLVHLAFQLSTVGLGIFILFWGESIEKPNIKEYIALKIQTPYWFTYIPFVLFTVLTLILLPLLNKLFIRIPMVVENSDILPLIRVMCTRYLNGVFPYDLVTEFGYAFPPTYLPAQWMVFLPAHYFHFDPRWISTFFYLGVVLFIVFDLYKKNKNPVFNTLIVASAFLLLFGLNGYEPFILGVTVEILLSGYYLLLSYSVLTKSVPLRILAFSLCLLSRFSFIFWIPLYFLVVWITESKQNAIKIFAGVFLICCIFYGGFLIKDPLIFSKSQAHYTSATIDEWKHGNPPFHLYNGVGAAIYFYELESFVVPQKLLLIKVVVVCFSMFCLGLLVLLFIIFKNKIDINLFSLVSLKFLLVIFYFFVQIPYLYLYLVPLSITLGIILVFLLKEDSLKLEKL